MPSYRLFLRQLYMDHGRDMCFRKTPLVGLNSCTARTNSLPIEGDYMKLLLGILVFTSMAAQAATSIVCDRVSWEDEGAISINFAGEDLSPLRNLEETCGGEYSGACKSRYFTNVSYQPVGTWPLGIYSGTNHKGYGFVVTLTAYNPASAYQRYTGYAVTLNKTGNSVDNVSCYKIPFEHDKPDCPPDQNQDQDQDDKAHTQSNN